ncbi:glycosyltransferase [Carboxylicivirga mesophila]|uniref:Glycosyltransferase n=1 Tax=Carboxylicivirga mesophila TaxID=1166478 RepID=A0ABS5KB08_9BACT|nr:glycosyltransferase [Carboxylicivirga mesophila]MBS2212126.1 glycosyltransferase [Carboxylicivirga mesophila]
MNKLCLYTLQFPYGLGEQFLETEIKYLAEEFNQVFIFPAQSGDTKRDLPKNVKVIDVDFEGYSSIKGLLSLGMWFIKAGHDVLVRKNKIFLLSSLMRLHYQAQQLYIYLNLNKLTSNTIHYTYWMDDWTTILSILKSKNKISVLVSRAHGFDLYNERHESGFIPFRSFQLQCINWLYLISQNGFNYLKERHPEHTSKMKISYLGTYKLEDTQVKPIMRYEYVVVSCSRVVNLKRLDLIIKSLSQISTLPIKWIHFGDGEQLGKIKSLAKEMLPSNVTAEFKGMVSNTEVLKYYSENQIDCFINLSNSEGLPVSIMEAISYGIPVLATNVGGTNEIVNEKTGCLIDVKTESEEIARQIEILLNGQSRNEVYRKEVYAYWKDNFCAATNYKQFVKDLKTIF